MVTGIGSTTWDLFGFPTWIADVSGAPFQQAVMFDLGIQFQSGGSTAGWSSLFPTGSTWRRFDDVQFASANPYYLMRGALDDPQGGAFDLSFISAPNHCGSIGILCGVDLIALEMCSHPVYAPLIIEAAVATGLPVWLGLSCKQDANAGLVGFDSPHAEFRGLVADLADCGAGVINIMHSTVDDTTAGLSVLSDFWQGPMGAYPESGYFVMPNWQFVDIIDPDDLVKRARGWSNSGVRVLGGCCGLGVPHIKALKAAFG